MEEKKIFCIVIQYEIEIIYIIHGAVQRTLVLSRDFYL